MANPLLFGIDFDESKKGKRAENPADQRSPEPPPPEMVLVSVAQREQAAAVAAAGQAGYQAGHKDGYAEGHQTGTAEGHAAGMEEMRSSLEQEISIRLEQITQAIEPSFAQFGAIRDGFEKAAVDVGVAVIHRLLPEAATRHGLAEIEALIEESVKVLTDEPRLIIRLMEQQGEHVKARIDPVLERHGFEGRVLVLVDETLGPSDIKLEWTDGGAQRLMSMAWASVDAAMRRVRGDQAALGDPPPVDEEATEPDPRPQHMAQSGELAPDPPPPEPEPEPEPGPETEMDAGDAAPAANSEATQPSEEHADPDTALSSPDVLPSDAMPIEEEAIAV